MVLLGGGKIINRRRFRRMAAGLALAPLMFWTVPLLASIDLDPKLHLGDLNIPQDVFPTPTALKDNVSFWRRVYSEWRLDQVALHDAAYPALIYEVVDLKGKAAESLTPDQTDQIERHRDALEKRLARLAAAGDDVASLSDSDRALRQNIIDAAGKVGLADAASRVRVQRGLRERFLKGLEASGRYDRAFRQIFREEGVPEDLVYLPHVESSFQNRARSSVGAAGMWQFTRSAGRLFLTVNRSIDQRLDPMAAARGAARYLHQAYQMLGDWPLAVTSYNHGIQGMLRAKAQYGTDFNRIVNEYESRSFGFASRNFYAEFLAAREVARDRERYFPEGVSLQRPLALDSVVLDRPTRSRDLARYYDVKHTTLVSLNPAWTSPAARGRLSIPAGTEVWLPAGTLNTVTVEKPAAPAAAMPVSLREQAGPLRGGHDQESGRQSAVLAPSPISVFHIVRENESLSTIAWHYGLSTKTLRALNDIPPRHNTIRVGQKLRVRDAVEPVVGGGKANDMIIHVVRRGDTPWDIAANYGISLRELLANNQLTKHSKLRPGQRLAIPVGR
jgi:membrane-bound lytic murein transglycosylase D